MVGPMRYSPEDLAGNSAFLEVLRNLATTLREAHSQSPRLGRLMASHQRWMMTHAAMMLYLEDDSGLTIPALRNVVTRALVASHNTAQNYLEQIESFRLISRVASEPDGRRQTRRYIATPVAEEAMFNWYLANLAAMDMLDGMGRAQLLLRFPHLFRVAQPRMARTCLDNRAWCEPPPRVAEFLWTEAGGLVMDMFVARISDCQPTASGRIMIGMINVREMSEEFGISRTHLQRLLRRATEQGSIGHDTEKTLRSNRAMWYAHSFLAEYCSWQAIKFAAVNDAFLDALESEYSRESDVLGCAV